MDYLYALQCIRESSPDFVNIIFLAISEFISNFGFAIPALLYWCIDKSAGISIFFCYTTANFTNQMIKNIACVYRPWILDSRLYVYPKAAISATGYSFPSGHTVAAGTIYGGIALNQQKKRKWLTYLMMFFILLTAFSRNWLGAHTIVDVIISLFEAAFVMCLYMVFKYWFVKNQEKDSLIVFIGSAIVILLLLFMQFKKYPIDYAFDGSVLVDSYKMITDCYTATGLSLAALLGWWVDRKYIHYEVTGNWWQKLIRFLIGIIIVVGIKFGLGSLLKPIGEHFSHLIKYFIMGFFSLTAYPLLIKYFHNKLFKNTSDLEKK